MALPPFIVYLFGLAVLPLLPKRIRYIWMIAVAVLGFASVSLLESGQSGWILPFLSGMDLSLLLADGLSLFVGYIFAAISIIVVIYARAEERITHQAATLLQMSAGMGIIFAGDFITLFLFWELLALSSLALIWHGGKEAEGPGYRYALMHILGGVLLIGGIGIQYAETGSFQVGPVAPGLATIFFILGIGMNAAIVPLHAWLPDSYPRASITGSVILSIFTTKAAVYLLARTLPGTEALMVLGAFMIFYGITFALLQDDMRALLSYHIVSQVGYMVAAIGIGTTLAINGGVAHLFNNILYKGLLFMVVGAIIYQTGKNRLSELGGLRRQMPVTFAACVIASLAIAGVPGLNGFISKELIVGGAAESGYYILEILFLIGSIGTFLSFLKLNYYAFIRETKSDRIASDPSFSMIIAMAITALLCIIFGIYPQALFVLLPYPVGMDALSLGHAFEVVLKFAVVLLLIWLARSRIGELKYSLPDAMDLYSAFGRCVVYFSAVSLPAIATHINDRISLLAQEMFWISRNPIMAGEIMMRSFVQKNAPETLKTKDAEVVLLDLKNRYPGEEVGIRGPGYGIFFIAILLFAYFIMVFIL